MFDLIQGDYRFKPGTTELVGTEEIIEVIPFEAFHKKLYGDETGEAMEVGA